MDTVIIIVLVIQFLMLIFLFDEYYSNKKISEEYQKNVSKRINEIHEKIENEVKKLTNSIFEEKTINSKSFLDTKALIKKNNDNTALLIEQLKEELSTQNNKMLEIKKSTEQLIDNEVSKLSDEQASNYESLSSILDDLSSKIEVNRKDRDIAINQIIKKFDDEKEINTSIFENLIESIKNLDREYNDLKKKVDFFAGMSDDATKLNDQSMTTSGMNKENELVNQALSELMGKKKLKDTPRENKIESIKDKEPILKDNNQEENIETDPIIKPTSSFEMTENPDLVDETETEEKDANKARNDEVEEDYSNIELGSPEDVEDFEVPSFFDEQQKIAFKKMSYTDDNIFITGRAGTGKSLLLNVFSKSTTKNVLKLAPTGIAALNIDGTTVHSAFGYYNLVNLNIQDISFSNIKLSTSKKIVLTNVKTIIIDEISMLRSDVVEKMDLILKCLNRSNRPFGGKQMIFIGDPFQLPPVVRRNEERYLQDKFGGIYFFNASSFNDGDFRFIELSTNHRQDSDPEFYNMLNHIREGKFRPDDLTKLNTRIIDSNDESLHRVIRLFATRAEAEEMNNKALDSIYGKEYKFKSEIEYQAYPNQKFNIESNFPFSETLRLKIGASVMFVYNDIDKRWVNGQIGVVKEIHDDYIKVFLNDTDVQVDKMNFSQQEATYKDGKIVYKDLIRVRQFPLVLAYAITIHKSQGMTYPNIACDISNCFQNGQEYVALSRTVSLEGLHLLKPINFETVNVDPMTVNFYWSCLVNTY